MIRGWWRSKQRRWGGGGENKQGQNHRAHSAYPKKNNNQPRWGATSSQGQRRRRSLQWQWCIGPRHHSSHKGSWGQCCDHGRGCIGEKKTHTQQPTTTKRWNESGCSSTMARLCIPYAVPSIWNPPRRNPWGILHIPSFCQGILFDVPSIGTTPKRKALHRFQRNPSIPFHSYVSLRNDWVPICSTLEFVQYVRSNSNRFNVLEFDFMTVASSNLSNRTLPWQCQTMSLAAWLLTVLVATNPWQPLFNWLVEAKYKGFYSIL